MMSTLMRGVRVFFLETAHQRGHHRKQQLAEDIQEMKSLILSLNIFRLMGRDSH